MILAALALGTIGIAQSPVEQYSGYWAASNYCNGFRVISDSSNNAYIAGRMSQGTFSSTDMFVAKLNSSSVQQWFRLIPLGVTTFANDIARNATTGDIYVCGTRGTGAVSTISDGILTKIDSAGNIAWTRTFPAGRDGGFSSVDVTSAGNIVVTGSLQTTSGSLHEHAYTRMYDSSGGILWSHEYYAVGFSVDYRGKFVKVLGDGTLLVAGTAFGDDLLWLRYSEAGSLLNWMEYAHPTYDAVGGFEYDVDLATGDLYVGGAVGDTFNSFSDAFAARINLAGSVANTYVLPPGTGTNLFSSFSGCRFSGGKLYLCGSVPSGDDDADGIVVALNSDLTPYWNTSFINESEDAFTTVAYAEAQSIDAIGNRVVVTGKEENVSVADRLINLTYTANGTPVGTRKQPKDGVYVPDTHLLGTGAFLMTGSYSPGSHWVPTVWKMFDGVKNMINTTTVVGGQNFNLKVYLSDPAFNTNVTLSDNSSAITVPGSVNFPTGVSMVNVSVPTSVVAANTPVTISAFVNDGSGVSTTKTAAITVVPVPSIGTLTVSPSTAYGGSTINCTVSTAFRNGPTPTVITLGDNTGLLTTPPTATIPAGGSFANFTVAVGSVPTNTVKQITATYNAVTRTANVTLRPGLSLVDMPAAVTGGSVTAANVYLTGPAQGTGQTVTLQSSGPELNNPASMVIPGGATFARVKFSTDVVGANVSRTLSAVVGGVTRMATIAVQTGPALSTFVAPVSIVGGTSGMGTLTLTAAGAPSRYVAVACNLPLSAPDLVLVTASGTENFTINAAPVVSNTVRNVSASMGGVTRTRTITVTP